MNTLYKSTLLSLIFCCAAFNLYASLLCPKCKESYGITTCNAIDGSCELAVKSSYFTPIDQCDSDDKTSFFECLQETTAVSVHIFWYVPGENNEDCPNSCDWQYYDSSYVYKYPCYVDLTLCNYDT